VWEQDHNQKDCPLCKKDFGIINRRHHCRKCGSVVCGRCSKNKFLLNIIKDVDERVCDPCFKQLIAGPTAKDASKHEVLMKRQQALTLRRTSVDVISSLNIGLVGAEPAVTPRISNYSLSVQSAPSPSSRRSSTSLLGGAVLPTPEGDEPVSPPPPTFGNTATSSAAYHPTSAATH
jgi:hypothetical protein